MVIKVPYQRSVKTMGIAETIAAVRAGAARRGGVPGTIVTPSRRVSSAQLRAESIARQLGGGPTGEEFMPPAEPPIMQAGAGALMAIPAVAGVAARVLPRVVPALARVAPWIAAGAAGYGVSEMMEGEPGAIPGTAIPVQEGFLPWQQDIIPDEWVAYSWNTGTAVFYRLIDGRIAVQNKMGVWKVYRPKKHIVLSTNPRISQVNKLFRTCDKFTKKLAKTKYLKRQ